MSIRVKIMLGFVILASMLFISGAISIYEITRLGHSIKGLIDDNYRSIVYSKTMLNALEDQNKAVIGYIYDGDSHWESKFSKADALFRLYLDSAQGNLTLENGTLYIDSVRYHYKDLVKNSYEAFGTKGATLDWYINQIEGPALYTSMHVKELMTLNQNALYQSTSLLEISAQRATMPGLIVIFTSLLFTFVFTYLVHHYFVSPIIRLTKGINDYVRFRKPFDVPLETRDELFSLKEAISNLISICRFPKKE